ncbi:MAG: hypothetical protein IJ856_06785 [Candidatus Methanomethylophilaceae archaeon]|nr:hypothetical protein [Candidatus Methanomethylophilaceae archaeon]
MAIALIILFTASIGFSNTFAMDEDDVSPYNEMNSFATLEDTEDIGLQDDHMSAAYGAKGTTTFSNGSSHDVDAAMTVGV